MKDDILIYIEDLKDYFVDIISLALGIGVYSTKSVTNFRVNDSVGRRIELDEKLLHKKLPNHAPCVSCGTMLMKPSDYYFIGSCQKCGYEDYFAMKKYHAIQAKLLRREFWKSRDLRKRMRNYGPSNIDVGTHGRF